MSHAEAQTEILFTHSAANTLREVITRLSPTRCFLLYPQSSGATLLDTLGASDISEQAVHIPHAEGEQNKTLASASRIWETMLASDANRHSLIINLGGGLTTDLGGFAAACYMRSVRYVNVPTTLLADVDAACGGKTGVNLAGVKNIVGSFHCPAATIISPEFLATLPTSQILSGWAEMLKHSLLLSSESTSRYLNTNPLTLSAAEWLPLIEESVTFKRKITLADPHEKGLRRILNLGHTAGHAIEAFYSRGETSITHGHAIAVGLITALVLSHIYLHFDSGILYDTAQAIRRLYPPLPIKCDHYPALLDLMHHDKKNRDSGNVRFVLLHSAGVPEESCPTTDEDIRNALDITRDLMGI